MVIDNGVVVVGLIIFGCFVLLFLSVLIFVMMRSPKKWEVESEKAVSSRRGRPKKTLSVQHELPSLNESFKDDNELFKQEKKVVVKGDRERDDVMKNVNQIKFRQSKFSVQYWKDWWMDRKHLPEIVMINMELLNGFHRTFLVREREGGFKYKDKKYLFDNEMKYYNMDSKIYMYDFHENIALPIKRVIPVQTIQETVENSGISEVEYAMNPATLERFAVSKIAEGIMRGAELDDVFRFLKLMLIISVVVGGINLYLTLQSSGALGGITG